MSERLFTPRFLVMCGFSFAVFFAAFQLYPTAPFRILALGGSESIAGLFLGFMTYSAAFSAPFTGALADRIGKRQVLLVCSVATAALSATYAAVTPMWLLLALAIPHGVFWSGLLTSAGAYLADIIPVHRRAEGIGYYGLSTVLAVAVSPALGLALYRYGWTAVCLSAAAINLLMALVAWRLPDTQTTREAAANPSGSVVEWRVVALAVTSFLYAFGYGGVTSFSALYTASIGVTPRGIFFTVFAITSICTSLVAGQLGDRLGPARLLGPALALVAAGYFLLGQATDRAGLMLAAVVFGLGFRAAYQLFFAHVLQHVSPSRRGAAFGGVMAAWDTGIGTGSMAIGWIIDRYGFRSAYGTAALLAAVAIPYFYLMGPLIFRRGENMPEMLNNA